MKIGLVLVSKQPEGHDLDAKNFFASGMINGNGMFSAPNVEQKILKAPTTEHQQRDRSNQSSVRVVVF